MRQNCSVILLVVSLLVPGSTTAHISKVPLLICYEEKYSASCGITASTGAALLIRNHKYPVSSVGVLSSELRENSAVSGYPPSFSGRFCLPPWILIIFAVLFILMAGFLLYRVIQKRDPLLRQFENALHNREIRVWCQPVVKGINSKIAGFEVLARWIHPRRGFISPQIFIPLAEKSGLVDKLTHSLMTSVLEELRPVIPALPDGLHIGINISPLHQDFEQLRKDTQALLDVFGSKSLHLVLEITEGEAFVMTEGFRKLLPFFRQHSFALALDDFGTGYSGLASLAILPVKFIKLDKFFIQGITSGTAPSPVLDCIIDMADKLSLEIIAEGVERPQQAEYLINRGVSLFQGYLFGRPVPLSGLIRQIKSDGL